VSASVLLLSYRDAPYIHAALESALAQTVPCQIVVSNDCSDDGTFELAREMVANYHGPHRVSVRRNERNLGVAAHVNATVPLTTGDIVVMMAGDDISCPHRVATILEAFRRRPQATVLGSGIDGIDEHGHPLEFAVRPRPEVFGLDYYVSIGRLVGLLGATLAFRREVFERFGPLRGPIEDNALSLRGALLGECLNLRQPLVQYRQHADSVSAGVFARHEPPKLRMQRRYERTIRFYRGTADDLEHCLAQMPELSPRRRALARDVVTMYRIEADAREALLHKARHHWLKPIARGLLHLGLRRKSAERALKLFVPRRWFGLYN
jgi:glycosyltransferase involved in cell wall biosynthesis